MENAIVPLFCTAELDRTVAFYREHLGFRVSTEMPGYAELEQGEGGPRLAFMAPCETETKNWQAASGDGLVYCFRVDDADAEHARLAKEGVTIVEGPSDRPWGERGFAAEDPNGISLWIAHAIAMDPKAMEAAKAAAK